MKQTDYQADLPALGSFVRERRKQLGLTQQELGDRVDWVQERISLIENGKYGTPSLPLLAKLAAALEVAQTELLAAAGFLRVDEAPFAAFSENPHEMKSVMGSPIPSQQGHTLLAKQLARMRSQLSGVWEQTQTVERLQGEILSRRILVQELTRRLSAKREARAAEIRGARSI